MVGSELRPSSSSSIPVQGSVFATADGLSTAQPMRGLYVHTHVTNKLHDIYRFSWLSVPHRRRFGKQSKRDRPGPLCDPPPGRWGCAASPRAVEERMAGLWRGAAVGMCGPMFRHPMGWGDTRVRRTSALVGSAGPVSRLKAFLRPCCQGDSITKAGMSMARVKRMSCFTRYQSMGC